MFEPLWVKHKRSHPAHDKEYAAWIDGLPSHLPDCELFMCGHCTCFDWGYRQFIYETIELRAMG
jgi:hypothetical protein